MEGDDPRWSSERLDRLLATVINGPGGCVEDLFRAFHGILADFPGNLSKAKGHFIKDLVVKCFTHYRRSYDQVDWDGLVQDLKAGRNGPQLYFALLAIPPQFVSDAFTTEIKTGLVASPFREEAFGLLEK